MYVRDICQVTADTVKRNQSSPCAAQGNNAQIKLRVCTERFTTDPQSTGTQARHLQIQPVGTFGHAKETDECEFISFTRVTRLLALP